MGIGEVKLNNWQAHQLIRRVPTSDRDLWLNLHGVHVVNHHAVRARVRVRLWPAWTVHFAPSDLLQEVATDSKALWLRVRKVS
jgi:hypothetical protein